MNFVINRANIFILSVTVVIYMTRHCEKVGFKVGTTAFNYYANNERGLWTRLLTAAGLVESMYKDNIRKVLE